MKPLRIAMVLLVVVAAGLLSGSIAMSSRSGCTEGAPGFAMGPEPSWSPNGGSIAFVRDGAIWSVRTIGGRPACLSHPTRNQSDSSPTWDPTGQKIVFARLTFGSAGPTTSRLFVMNSGGSNVKLVSNHLPASSLYPQWFPGKEIVFSGACRLGFVSPNGAGVRLIRQPSLACVLSPTWNKRRDTIALSAKAIAPPSKPSLWSVNSRGRNLMRLTRGGQDSDPDWSPDDRTIVMSRDCRIALLNVKTGAIRFLTSQAGLAMCKTDPDWSPDGKRIAYAVLDAVYVMKPDGSGRRRIVSP